jgi:hypothetical protein
MGPVHKDRLRVRQAGRHSAHAQAAHNCARCQQCDTPHCSYAQAEYRRTASTDPGAKAVLIKRIHQIGGRENILRFHTYKNTGVVGSSLQFTPEGFVGVQRFKCSLAHAATGQVWTPHVALLQDQAGLCRRGWPATALARHQPGPRGRAPAQRCP